MKERWYGEKCEYQMCKFEKSDMSDPVLIYCNHKQNKVDCEGNCNKELCPIKR